eukprot:4665237-Karenia_brevis.AAC.1
MVCVGLANLLGKGFSSCRLPGINSEKVRRTMTGIVTLGLMLTAAGAIGAAFGTLASQHHEKTLGVNGLSGRPLMFHMVKLARCVARYGLRGVRIGEASHPGPMGPDTPGAGANGRHGLSPSPRR